jgi:phage terminase large subunit-like protein
LSSSSAESRIFGSQVPRYRTVPEYVSSDGKIATDLAAIAGLILDPGQADVLEGWFGRNEYGKWSASETAVVEPRQNGKGSILEAVVLAGLFLFNERLILWSAHEFKTAQEAFFRVRDLIQGCPSLKSRVAHVRVAAGQEGIELKNGARLRFVARSAGSGRGFSPDRVILDEAYALTDEQMSALMPALSARPDAQVCYASSAPLAESTVLRRIGIRGRKGSQGLAYFEWCAELDDDSNDMQAVAKANPAFGRRIFEDAVLRELGAMGDEEFRRERLGIWREEDVESVVDMNLWRALTDRTPRPLELPRAFAIDTTPDRTKTSIAVAELKDGISHLEVVEQLSTGTAVEHIAGRIAELHKKWKPVAIALDPAGPAGALIPALERENIRVTPESRKHTQLELVGARALAQACGAWYDAVINSQVRHADQPHLNIALQGAARRPLGDAWAWTRKDSAVDISPLVAITLAHHALSLYGHKTKKAVPRFVAL